MKKYLIYISFTLLTLSANAQSFVNGDLEGNIGRIALVTLNGWTDVLNTDPVSNAGAWSGFATADVISTLGPDATNGNLANPQSGNTCVSGLSSETSTGSIFHEGIKQTVSGFTIGTDYTLQFYQTVVKHLNALDISGSWDVYLDNTLLSTTAVSISLLPFNSTSLIWDQRSITFTATATSLTFKFLPKDDDLDQVVSTTNQNGALRMGIDNISFAVPLPIELIFFDVDCEDGYSLFTWQTATEFNNDYFTIEQSTNGESWEEVATISGFGNSNSIKTYDYKDGNKNTRETTYYRLKQTDFDGNYQYSNTESLFNCDDELTGSNLYPNPVTENSILEIYAQEKNTSLRFQIINMLGDIVQQKQHLILNSGMNKVKIDTDQLSTGMYILVLEKEGSQEQIKFTK